MASVVPVLIAMRAGPLTLAEQAVVLAFCFVAIGVLGYMMWWLIWKAPR